MLAGTEIQEVGEEGDTMPHCCIKVGSDQGRFTTSAENAELKDSLFLAVSLCDCDQGHFNVSLTVTH